MKKNIKNSIAFILGFVFIFGTIVPSLPPTAESVLFGYALPTKDMMIITFPFLLYK